MGEGDNGKVVGGAEGKRTRGGDRGEEVRHRSRVKNASAAFYSAAKPLNHRAPAHTHTHTHSLYIF